ARALEKRVKTRLKRRAESHSPSMAEEERQILRHALKDENGPPSSLASSIATRVAKRGLRTEPPELPAESPRAAGFGIVHSRLSPSTARHACYAEPAALQGSQGASSRPLASTPIAVLS